MTIAMIGLVIKVIAWGLYLMTKNLMRMQTAALNFAGEWASITHQAQATLLPQVDSSRTAGKLWD